MRGTLTKDMFDCIPELDFNTGSHYFLGNMENYINALFSMLKSIKSKLPLLKIMDLSEEYEGLRTISQTLRKMLRNIGAIDLAEESYQIETALLNDDFGYISKRLCEYIADLVVFSEHLELLLKKAEVNQENMREGQSSFLKYDFTKTKESIKRSSDFLEQRII